MANRILFYRPEDPYGFMSNFSHHSFEDSTGLHYRTSEHYFQCKKPASPEDRETVRNAPTPGSAARLGRTLSMRRDWNSPDGGPSCNILAFSRGLEQSVTVVELVKDRVMLEALTFKFMAHEDIRKELVATDGSFLIEDASADPYWGWGPSKTGRNKLGVLLQFVRDSYLGRAHFR